ncbi:MAG: shikimate kinase [Candidatus Diapherotrites archaeon]|jgi:shikimate kinase|uniref:shikimate kinase n=1 Tax=Candidatus Iainarchaeum sp. TaxID=3101447 RepID=A0A8T5GE58_9ARCH|nr:shikimate kinase [Candidatus Diapherotrites archaeon]MBT7241499.1 shikimate kinase [Candidatus Diapherotrites archaeon]
MSNLFLIGYRGTGKTVIGRGVAKKMAMAFIDTDALIVELAGKSIPKIFEDDGEEIFRKWETKALEQACGKADAIISCGGGIITQERNFPLLATGIVCLLTADTKTIFKRIFRDGNRPALTNKDPFDEIIHLLEVRAPLYDRAKNFEVETSIKNVNECVDEVIQKYSKFIKKLK